MSAASPAKIRSDITTGAKAFPKLSMPFPQGVPADPIEPYEAITSREADRGPQQQSLPAVTHTTPS